MIRSLWVSPTIQAGQQNFAPEKISIKNEGGTPIPKHDTHTVYDSIPNNPQNQEQSSTVSSEIENSDGTQRNRTNDDEYTEWLEKIKEMRERLEDLRHEMGSINVLDFGTRIVIESPDEVIRMWLLMLREFLRWTFYFAFDAFLLGIIVYGVIQVIIGVWKLSKILSLAVRSMVHFFWYTSKGGIDSLIRNIKEITFQKIIDFLSIVAAFCVILCSLALLVYGIRKHFELYQSISMDVFYSVKTFVCDTLGKTTCDQIIMGFLVLTQITRWLFYAVIIAFIMLFYIVFVGIFFKLCREIGKASLYIWKYCW